MSIPSSPYAAFAALLSSAGHSVSPAELHGLLLGRSCAGAGFEPDPWLVDAAELLGSAPQDNVRAALIGLQEMVKAELTGSEMAVVLLLPSDDAPLAERAARSIGDSYLVARDLAEPQAQALIEAAKTAFSATHSILLLSSAAMVGVLAVVVFFMLSKYLARR